jgi:uncharacterized protein (DUF433 family)
MCLMNIAKYIEIDPRVCNGKPVIEGTRVPVSVIVDLLSSGENIDTIQAKFPELSQQHIIAALNYCHSILENSDIEAVAV